MMLFTSVILVATGLIGELVKSLAPNVANYRLRSIVRPEGATKDRLDD